MEETTEEKLRRYKKLALQFAKCKSKQFGEGLKNKPPIKNPFWDMYYKLKGKPNV